ncbi:hypothetical protein Ais01nite_00460 [Asanoa ishikariensis]|uniref:Streptogrisin C n=1 Tax=Asanoa ishikariensis TaxID=137265 RepID=A0A1H3TQG9_9ACTN|nr:hypothetical protein Ais01nite_00460 [Asanoa ishikariensis]SDZ52257.1 hypothetical protein SAMN05421684_6177 [Asanoa ishikariensis]
MRRPMVITSCVLAMTLIATSSAYAKERAIGGLNEISSVGFAASVDVEAMNSQFHRLEALAAAHPGGAGGTYFDEATGELVVRQVTNVEGGRLRSAVSLRSRLAGEVPVRFEATTVSMRRLEAATKALQESRSWAGASAASVHGVSLDRLAAQIVINASGDADALIAAAVKSTGLTPRVAISKAGKIPASRRVASSPYPGGTALFDYNVTAANHAPRLIDAFCTAGFRMTRGGTNSNWMTTAGHCGTNGTQFWNNGWNFRVSSNYQTLGTDVSMLAGQNGAGFSRNSWFGERDATTLNPVSGKNTGWPAIGSAVYVSGSNGGLVYGRVINTNIAGCAGYGSRVIELDTRTGNTNDGSVVGGDSGGPVTRWNTGTAATNDMVAVGTVSCSDRYEFVDVEPIHRIEAATGAVVVVGGT